MKTQYTEAEETRIENEVEGVRETSDSSVASRGNVKNTLKEFNKHLEEHYYDTSEINYFFDKIWHFIKKHVIHTDYFVTVLGKIRGSHVDSASYNKIKNKPVSVESVDNLVETINEKVTGIEESISEVNTRVDNIHSTLPVGFVYTEYKEEESARELWPDEFWINITSNLYKDTSTRPFGINQVWKKSDYEMSVNCIEGLSEYTPILLDAEDFVSKNKIGWLINETNNYYKNMPTQSARLNDELKNCAYVIFGSKRYLYVNTISGPLFWEDTPTGLQRIPAPVSSPSFNKPISLGGTENRIYLVGEDLYWYTGFKKEIKNIFGVVTFTTYQLVKIKHLIEGFALDTSSETYIPSLSAGQTVPYLTEEILL